MSLLLTASMNKLRCLSLPTVVHKVNVVLMVARIAWWLNDLRLCDAREARRLSCQGLERVQRSEHETQAAGSRE